MVRPNGKANGTVMPHRKRKRLSDKDFDRVVQKAIARIPQEIRQHLDNILISVQKRPSPALLEELGFPADEPLLGVFWGVPLMDRSVTDPEPFADRIFLFQEVIEETCETMEELEEEIEITVVHEIAHALGIDEDRLAELGYD
jgi:predicted Zn-dependent protease with MMP-like domain